MRNEVEFLKWNGAKGKFIKDKRTDWSDYGIRGLDL